MTQVGIKNPDIFRKSLVTASLGNLTLQGIDPAILFGKNIRNPKQITFGVFQFPQGLLLLLLRLGNSSRFLKNLTTILRACRKQHIDLPLLHNGIRRTTNTGIHKQLSDVAKAAAGSVNQILRFAISIDPAGHGDFIKFCFQCLLAIGQSQRDFRHPVRFPLICSIKNNVCHLTSTERFGRGLTQDPTNRINDIGLTTAIWTHNPGHSLGEFKDRLVGK